ncbi:MAG: penicillin-binding protein activator [Deltaproteobacteria bacterium]|nr:penicillin-binding protein activator [Deltaproteobacteria bacterium]
MTINKVPYFIKAITVLIAVMAFFVFSCEKRIIVKEPPEKVAVRVPPEKKIVIDYFSEAENYWIEKKYEKALAAYDLYLTVEPKGERVRDALTRKAMIYYTTNQYEEALPLFLEVIEDYPMEKRAEIHLLTAKTYFHLQKYPESRLSALRWLEIYTYYPGREEVFFLLGQTLKELHNNPQAFYWWLKVLESSSVKGEEKEKIRLQLLDLIYQGAEDELMQMAAYAEESDLVYPIYYQLTLFYLISGRLEKAREAVLNVVSFTPEEEWAIKPQELLQMIDERLEVRPNVIGCLLPLSGPFALYGQEVLNGLELGFDIFQENEESLSSMELVIRDTEGDPEIAIEAIKELTVKEKALVTIGPLISKVAEGVVEKAQELGMPIITLSQSDAITKKGEMVFQNCLNPEDQLRSLVNKVVGEMGLIRFAILYPANSYGKYFMNKLWDKVESNGGVITAVESYDPKSTDFAVEIKKMVGLFYPRPKPNIEEEEEEKEEDTEQLGQKMEEQDLEEEPEPIVDFDAVFIPDSYERAGLIASQLAYHDVLGVTLLGTNLWNSPKLIDIAGRYVHGAIFPSGFFSGSGYIGVDSFVDQYRASFGQEPQFLAAIGYDTIRVVKEILKEKGKDIKTRENFRSALAGNKYFDSVTGPMFFDDERRAKRDPLLLTISGRHFFPMP